MNTPHEHGAAIAKLIAQLERILPGLENSNSAAEDAMVEALPSVISALKGERNAGIEAAAKLIDKKVSVYVEEFGMYDPSTGQTEFSVAGEEYLATLEELAEEVRALKAEAAQ